MSVAVASHLPEVLYTDNRHFGADRQGRTRKSSPNASISARDNQYPGQRPGKVEAKVCLLDPSLASRGQGNSQGSLGCPSSEPSIGYVGEGAEGGRGQGAASVALNGSMSDSDVVSFFVDVQPKYGLDSASHIPLYDALHSILGAAEEPDAPESRRCFNCGSPDHAVSDCPVPRNKALITLSRQYFNFFKEQSLGNFRFHAVEDWKRQRLEWLESFDPGHIRGDVLRNALGLEPGDPGERVEWLRNMALWGYPKGWTGSIDPRLRVHERIVREDQDSEEEDPPLDRCHLMEDRCMEAQENSIPCRRIQSSSGRHLYFEVVRKVRSHL